MLSFQTTKYYIALLIMNVKDIHNHLFDKVENVPELHGDHLEADTRVEFHAKHADEVNAGNIVIRANDTDIMVILITNAVIFGMIVI